LLRDNLIFAPQRAHLIRALALRHRGAYMMLARFA